MKYGQLAEFRDALLIFDHRSRLDSTPASLQQTEPRFTIGCVYPEAFAATKDGTQPSTMHAECLFAPQAAGAEIEIILRFLQPRKREIGRVGAPFWPRQKEPTLHFVPELNVAERCYRSGFETTDREILASVQPGSDPTFVPFLFPGSRVAEPVRDAEERVVAVVVRHQPPIAGTLELTTEPAGAGGAFRLSLRLVNRSGVSTAEAGSVESVLPRTFILTHAILRAHAAEFISLTAPPTMYAAAAAACTNEGVWPVLVGDKAAHECDTMLAAPTILPDYPEFTTPETPRGFDEPEPFEPHAAMTAAHAPTSAAI
jgi:hypothetical protein